MQLCHTPAALSAVFDEPNLIACAGLVPATALADRIGLRDLAEEWLAVPGSQGAAGAKVMSLVAGMLACADSIDDMDLLRQGGMDKVFTGPTARTSPACASPGSTGPVRPTPTTSTPPTLQAASLTHLAHLLSS